MVQNKPNANPTNNDSLVGTFSEFEKAMRLRLNNMLPVEVVRVDPARPRERVFVQPMVDIITTRGDRIKRPVLGPIPVLIDGGGGHFISFSLKPGDLGWIKANDRDISAFLQNYQRSAPADFRLQDFSSAVFQPDVMHGFTISDDDSGALVLQSMNGETKISLSPERIRITHPILVECVAPDIDYTGNLKLNGDIHITGTEYVGGEVTTGSTITASGDVVGAGISLQTHLHTGSPTSPLGPVSPTGVPVP